MMARGDLGHVNVFSSGLVWQRKTGDVMRFTYIRQRNRHTHTSTLIQYTHMYTVTHTCT